MPDRLMQNGVKRKSVRDTPSPRARFYISYIAYKETKTRRSSKEFVKRSKELIWNSEGVLESSRERGGIRRFFSHPKVMAMILEINNTDPLPNLI